MTKDIQLVLLLGGFIGLVLLFAQLKLFSIDAPLREISKKFEHLDRDRTTLGGSEETDENTLIKEDGRWRLQPSSKGK